MTAMPLVLASVLAAWAGISAFALQSPTQRHRSHLPPQRRATRLAYMSGGMALFAISLFAALGHSNLSFAIVLWICQAGVLGVAWTCLLPYAGPWMAWSSRAAVIVLPLLLVAAR